MLQSELFPKTKKEAPKGAESVNHKLLVRAGFIDQLMAGGWTLLPLGWRVIQKINHIIREEMNAIGGQELLMPLLHPKSIWNETGRWHKAGQIMYKLKDTRGRDFALSFTHEEIVMDLLRKHIVSFKDLPLALYHFSTKFRNEPRARSGILRGREFMMKDLYSAHADEKDLMDYYDKVKNAYVNIFKRLGFDFRITEASGGVFTDKKTHEFQVLAEGGEDTIYYCDECNWGANQEVAKFSFLDKKINSHPRIAKEECPGCGRRTVKQSKSIEVGNIFPLGTWYSQHMRVYYADRKGKKKLVWFGSYGIGPTRTMGAWVEVSHDKDGIIWNKTMSPFNAHLIEVKSDKKQAEDWAKEVYQRLKNNLIEVLWDDRDLSAGEKFTDADLIGIPVRLVVSEKTGNKIEWKERQNKESNLLNFEAVVRRLKY